MKLILMHDAIVIGYCLKKMQELQCSVDQKLQRNPCENDELAHDVACRVVPKV